MRPLQLWSHLRLSCQASVCVQGCRLSPKVCCMNMSHFSSEGRQWGDMVTAKQAHPGFNQLICASPAVKVRLKGGLNRSAAPLLHLASLGYHETQREVTASLHAFFTDGASWSGPARALQGSARLILPISCS